MKNSYQIELLLVFIFLNSLGFPGTYTEVFGDTFGILIEYASFGMQILAMLLSSGNSVLDIQLVNIKFQYLPLYQFIIIVFSESMLGAREPSVQLITCVRLAVTILFAIWMSENVAVNRIVELICIAQIILDISIILLAFIHPSVAFQDADVYVHALRGVYTAKNALASELSFGTIMVFMLLLEKYRAQERCVLWLAIMGIHLILLVMCQATGAVLIAGLVILYLIFFTGIRPPLPWLYIAVNIGFLFIALTVLPFFSPVLELFGKDATLTGRTELWNGIITFMTGNNTFTGFGYGRFWMDRKAVAGLHMCFDHTSYFSRMSTGAHNQILELWLNTGLIGIGSFFLAVLGSLRTADLLTDKIYGFISPVFYYLLLCGLTERIFENAYGYRLLIFFIIMAMSCNQENLEKLKGEKSVRSVLVK
ncbi:MAG: O-antigen ligase family protein [Eubacteriales bacterium]|nr:O-antigen ligase family protein [Eubacteriales bacterium]